MVNPQVGAANTPYARTVQPRVVQTGSLPDASVIFDSIMMRKHREKHPSKISSMLFYLASIIVHDLFRTDHNDFRNSQTSSYLDLSPLYGSVMEEQRQMRTFKDGKLKPDCFSEKRLMNFPPGVGCILIMFNRFHNHVVNELALINENGKFTKPEEGKKRKYGRTWERYDEDLFQTGRLITCGLYINIILNDYLRVILNLNRTDSNWQLDPRAKFKDGPPMGTGNQVSAEFNLVYRWHSTISDRDEEWLNNMWKELFPELKPTDITEEDFFAKMGRLEAMLSDDPQERPFAGLSRAENGSFDDDGIAKVLIDSIEDCANSFGAQRVPGALRIVEILGIRQARVWQVATLNEFRKHFNLMPHTSFESINADPEVAESLRRLYDEPNLVELYPGLVAEEAKMPGPGQGLAPSYTVSRALLSDAVSLVRGDRFYTIDYHPKKLTNWGYNEIHPDYDIDNGCLFYKLFLRTLPTIFHYNSIYAHYPLTVPSETRKILYNLNKAGKYNFDRPRRRMQPKMVLSYSAAKDVLRNQQVFKVIWDKPMENFVGVPAKNFMLAGDGESHANSRQLMSEALYVPGWCHQVKEYYRAATRRLLSDKSYKLAGVNQVDIVREVGNLVHVHFCAEMFTLPLKTEEISYGLFTEHQLYLIMANLYIVIYLDTDPALSFPIHRKACDMTKQLGYLIEANVTDINFGGYLSNIMRAVMRRSSPLEDYGIHMIRRLLNSGMDVHELVWGHIIGTTAGMVGSQGKLFAETIEYFLVHGKEHLPELRRLAMMDTKEDDETLLHYFLEGSRLNGETSVSRLVAESTSVVDGQNEIQLTEGDRVCINLRAASQDPSVFPNPEKLDLTRPVDSYIHLGAGPHKCLGLPMARVALTTVFKEVVKLENLRPVPGPQGRLQKVLRPFGPDDSLPEKMHYHAYLTEKHTDLFPLPCSKYFLVLTISYEMLIEDSLEG